MSKVIVGLGMAVLFATLPDIGSPRMFGPYWAAVGGVVCLVASRRVTLAGMLNIVQCRMGMPRDASLSIIERK